MTPLDWVLLTTCGAVALVAILGFCVGAAIGVKAERDWEGRPR